MIKICVGLAFLALMVNVVLSGECDEEHEYDAGPCCESTKCKVGEHCFHRKYVTGELGSVCIKAHTASDLRDAILSNGANTISTECPHFGKPKKTKDVQYDCKYKNGCYENKDCNDQLGQVCCKKDGCGTGVCRKYVIVHKN